MGYKLIYVIMGSCIMPIPSGDMLPGRVVTRWFVIAGGWNEPKPRGVVGQPNTSPTTPRLLPSNLVTLKDKNNFSELGLMIYNNSFFTN